MAAKKKTVKGYTRTTNSTHDVKEYKRRPPKRGGGRRKKGR